MNKLFFCLTAVALCACTQKMALQGRGSAELLRRPPEGTIARGQLSVFSPPERITLPLLERGRERFDINCSPCHGFGGYGDGILPRRGFLAPPSYHITRLRGATDQHFFDVMTQGYGAMYSYADRLDAGDRWAVVAYIRALQFSQNPIPSRLTAADEKNLEEAARP